MVKTAKTRSKRTARRVKIPKYKSFRLSKKLKTTQPKPPSSYSIFKQTFSLIKSQWKFFIILSLVYGAFSFLFVRGATGGLDVTELKDILNDSFAEIGFANLTTSVTIFGVLLSSSAAVNNEVVLMYQTIIVLIVSLAVIWGLRQMQTTEQVSVKDAFYQGMFPLIPVLLILFVIGLQLLPASIGATIYTITILGGIAVTAIEKAVWVVLVLLLVLLSFYMIASSIFALYIATLPNMTPMRALRSARQLVMHRRWMVMRKMLYLSIVLLLIAGFAVVPIIAFMPVIAELVFFTFSIAILPFVHTYMYTLYRKML